MSDGGNPQPVPRVLIVDDAADQLDLVAEVLERAGYIAELAKHGAEALESIRQYPPDLIILDLVMPGMDGPTFLEACRGEGLSQDVPIVVISGIRDPREAAGLPQVKAALAKPYDVRALLGIVKELLRHA